ncbi:MAG TPA: S8 family serine peptidase [Gemmataceae bacterium]|jgi:hypothetical protein|nr:S8 family serine peptidase [Gemmataceae bacterium]
MRFVSTRWLALLLAALGPAGAAAQIKTPKPPDSYDAAIRYRINADRNERVLQFEQMVKHFGGLGFKETAAEDGDLAAFDPAAEKMFGTVPSKTARDLLRDPRVQTVVLTPAGFMAPEDPQSRVRVLIEVASNRQQVALFAQTDAALKQVGFRKDIGFDSRGFTTLRGTVPVAALPTLLKDLRLQPSGWVLPELADELYVKLPDGTRTPYLVRPFADGVPVRTVEVLGPAEAPPAAIKLPPIPAEAPGQVKFTADLRRRLAEEGAREKPARLEVVLAFSPTDLDYEWRNNLIQAGATIEGRVGPVITVSVPQGARAEALSALPEVVAVRTPRLASSVAADAPAPSKKEGAKEEPKELKKDGELALPPKEIDDNPVKQVGLDRLHAAGKTGQGARVVVLDTDFAGWKAALSRPGKGASRVAKTTFIDMTAERNRTVLPEPMPGEFGRGTHAALAVRLAAPEAELTLVRVPADAPYQIVNVGRAIRGDDFRTEGLLARRRELGEDIQTLQSRKDAARLEYRRAFEDFGDDGPARERRLAAQQALARLEQEERATLERMGRINDLETALVNLKGADVVLGMLYWNSGFALDAASATSKFLDDWLARPQGGGYQRHLTRANPKAPPLWFQPAGDTRGQTWTGPFRDADNNGIMEFAGAGEKLRAERWTNELNFLARRSGNQDVVDLPAGAKVRVSVQWWEPHDRELSELDYRNPVAQLKLQIVKQRDPSGEKYASDEIDLIAESEGLPTRLHLEPHFGVYEHSLELTLPADGRYALRMEGSVPNRTRPQDVPTLVSQEIKWDLRPRIFVESVDGTTDYLLADFAVEQGGVAVPADARNVIAVGAADRLGRPLPYSASGAGPMTQLAAKPDVYAPVALPQIGDQEPAARGTSLAAAFAAGMAATLRSAGVQPGNFPQSLRVPPGGLLAVPPSWPVK